MAVLTRGRIGQIGTPEEIYRDPRSAYVASFIGETNLIDGQLVETADQFAKVETTAGFFSGRITDPEWKPVRGGAVRLSIRPEAWRLHKEEGDNPLTGKISERAYLGQRIQYWIETADGRQQVVEMNPHVIHEPGESPVTLHARRDDVVILKA
jgi:iron(III) transport system ATP-binding protein